MSGDTGAGDERAPTERRVESAPHRTPPSAGRPSTAPASRGRTLVTDGGHEGKRDESEWSADPRGGSTAAVSGGETTEAVSVAPWKCRQAIENAGHAVLFTDTEGRIEYANGAFEEMTGYDRTEVIGERPSLWQSGEHDDAFYADLWETITDGDVWKGELVNARKDGEQYVIEQTIAPIYRDGEKRGYVAINTDITEKRERERKVEALHRATRDLLSAEDQEAVGTEVGEAVEAILGFPINVVRFREGEKLVPIHVDDRSEELLGERPPYDVTEGPAGEALKRGETLVYDDVTELEDDHDRGPVSSWLYVPVGEHGVVSVGQTDPGAFDETDVRLVEILANNAETALDRLENERELRRENERLQRFASTVSHDLRNPLNVAEGTLAEMRSLTDQLERMTRAHERMEEVIEGVLTLARQGERVEDPGRVELEAVARACWEHVTTDGAELVVETDGTRPATVEADEPRLKHLFENLFRNAITHGGAATIRVGALDDGFYVEDDGEGVPPDQRESVFETGYTTATEGTGLGLSIVREIAEAHGWEVALTESESGGARFEFRARASAY